MTERVGWLGRLDLVVTDPTSTPAPLRVLERFHHKHKTTSAREVVLYSCVMRLRIS
jgi:hypothetical protein